MNKNRVPLLLSNFTHSPPSPAISRASVVRHVARNVCALYGRTGVCTLMSEFHTTAYRKQNNADGAMLLDPKAITNRLRIAPLALLCNRSETQLPRHAWLAHTASHPARRRAKPLH
ncbi:hypothetical protein GCK32_021196 [Trichostrongylus colubriformis]|uniref:Uncharacterized protein n=1 Tax=Trichostrongylus colubriformis TaxID=6319 RepID=A0AAN8FTI6_TRICO